MSNNLLRVLLLVGCGTILSACSDANFTSTTDLASSEKAGRVAETDVLVEEVVDDGNIDQNESNLLDEFSCSRNLNAKKVRICHLPPGNIANARTLCISENALQAHIGRHGDGVHVDFIGSCLSGNNGDDGTEIDDGDDGDDGDHNDGDDSDDSNNGDDSDDGDDENDFVSNL